MLCFSLLLLFYVLIVELRKSDTSILDQLAYASVVFYCKLYLILNVKH